MGNCRSGVSSTIAPTKEVIVLLLGLDNSGKSTLLSNLCGEPTEETTPTIGFSSTRLDMNKFQVKFYDLGGGSRLRSIWRNYYSEAYGCIFVVDAAATDRLDEVKDSLIGILTDEKMKEKPVLIFANKQDSSGTISNDRLCQELGLSTALEDSAARLTHVMKCIALKSASRNKMDPSIRQGLHWLLDQIGRQYEALSERVHADMTQQRAAEAQKRKERSERVGKIKEERERLKVLAGVSDLMEVEEIETGGNPFKPIAQAVVETEAREKAIKVQSEELQKRLSTLDEEDGRDNSSRRVRNVDGGNASGVGVGNNGVVDGDVGGGGESGGGVSGGGEDGGGWGEDKSSSNCSGLSSSGSLTDVTLKSCDSLQVRRPSSSQQSKTPHTQGRDPVGNGMTESKKTKKRSTLLSRMKNRNRTAPSKVTPTTKASESPKAPAVLAPIHFTPSLPTLSLPSKSHLSLPLKSLIPVDSMAGCPELDQESGPLAHSFFPSLPIVDQTIVLQGLPDLCHARAGLPPMQVIRQTHGLAYNLLHTEEDISNIPLCSITKLSPPLKPLPYSN